jgi:hypothetical protein
MNTTTTQIRIAGAFAVALTAAVLLAPGASARPVSDLFGNGAAVSGGPIADVTTYHDALHDQGAITNAVAIPDVFERAVLRNRSELGGVATYRDAGHTQPVTTGAAVYPDAFERAVQRQPLLESPTSGGDSYDWGLLASLSSLGALGAVLCAGVLLGTRRRTRLA